MRMDSFYGLSIPGRLSYYKAVCESLGLNPLTRPFDYDLTESLAVLESYQVRCSLYRADGKQHHTAKISMRGKRAKLCLFSKKCILSSCRENHGSQYTSQP